MFYSATQMCSIHTSHNKVTVRSSFELGLHSYLNYQESIEIMFASFYAAELSLALFSLQDILMQNTPALI